MNIQICQPLVGIPVIIKTNWNEYEATLQKSDFGGHEFHVIGSPHKVQLTTVVKWEFIF